MDSRFHHMLRTCFLGVYFFYSIPSETCKTLRLYKQNGYCLCCIIAIQSKIWEKSFAHSCVIHYHTPVSSSLKSSNRSIACAAVALWNGLPIKTSASLLMNPLNFTYPLLALSYATYHWRLRTDLFKLFYSNFTPAPWHINHHHRLQP